MNLHASCYLTFDSATTKAAATTLIAHVTACVSPALATPHEIKVATKLGASTRIPRRRRRRRKEGDTLGVD